jgi:uncharacterized protein YeaO (DUF488 family)
MTISLKRVYEKPSRADGTRVLVDRLWPRGLTKESAATDAWLRDIAPSNELRKWFHAHSDAWPEFRKRYLKELSGPAASNALQHLYALVQKGKVTLLYASKNEDRNNATVLKELLEGARKPPTGTGPSAARAMRGRQAARAPRR